MRWYDYVGWIGTIAVLVAYATGSALLFAGANMVLWPVVVAPSVYRRAWSAAAISFAFGAIGTVTWLAR